MLHTCAEINFKFPCRYVETTLTCFALENLTQIKNNLFFSVQASISQSIDRVYVNALAFVSSFEKKNPMKEQ